MEQPCLEDWWEESGDWFLVTMYDYYSGIPVGDKWPIFARNFDEAMTAYLVLIKWSMHEREYYGY